MAYVYFLISLEKRERSQEKIPDASSSSSSNPGVSWKIVRIIL